MITLDEVPSSGILIVSVFFDGYKDSFQNDSRRRLVKIIDDICKEQKLNVDTIPLSFSLIKTVSADITRAMGAQYEYGYSNLKGEDLKIIYAEIKKKKKPWWTEIKFMIATDVEGLE